MSYYHNLMLGWLFTKSNQKDKSTKFGLGGLGYRSKTTLDKVAKMNVGDKISTNGYTLTRVN
jgi:hypothetical protein